MESSNSPLEEEEVDIVVFLGEEVAQDAGGVGRLDLVCRQVEVHTLDEVPQRRRLVLREWSADRKNVSQGVS